MRLLLPACLLASLLASPALAEPAPNLADTPAAAPGAVAALSAAHRLHAQALATADTRALLDAIRLARPITIRPASGWTLTTSGTAPPGEPQGATAPVNPAGPEAIAIALAFAGEDPDLQDLVYDLDVQGAAGQSATVAAAASTLAAGQTDTWRIAFFGLSPAELAVIGDGDTPLSLTVTDEAGNPVCDTPAEALPAPCAFTPARNGFFSVIVKNTGTVTNSYQLLAN